jgi:hypothetical protein
MHFGVVDHIRASALTTADRRPPSWNRITDSTHARPGKFVIFMLSIIIEKKILKLTAFIKPDGIHIQA